MFSHRNDPSRGATLTLKPDAALPVFVVVYDDAKGKTRKKSFKNAQLGRARDAALRFLLNKEGFLIRGPQDGTLKWMARIQGPYMGELRHSVAPDTGVSWVVDGNNTLMRIHPESCTSWQGPLDSAKSSPHAYAWADRGGRVWVLAPSWERVDGELVQALRLLRVQDGPEPVIQEHLRVQGPGHLFSLHGDALGQVLGPAPGGAALYGRDGELLRQWPLVSRGENMPPLGALSPCGRWVVFVQSDVAERIDLQGGPDIELPCPHKTLNGLQISSKGEIYVSGFHYPSHGLFRLGPDGPVRVSTDIRAILSPDGTQIAEAQHGKLTLRDAFQASQDPFEPTQVLKEIALPLLGMAKYGSARFGTDGLIRVLSDAYTLGAIDPSEAASNS
ncbi:MAG: hypothetical protein ACI9VR_003542 [Cognaticolwellia sp.]